MHAASRCSPEAARGARYPPRTPAAQGNTGRIDDRESKRKINDSLDHRLPIGAQGHAMLDQHFTLAGAVENQAMVPARRRCYSRSEKYVGDGGVVAVGADQQGPHSCFIADGGNEIGRQRVAFERDTQRLRRRVAQRETSC